MYVYIYVHICNRRCICKAKRAKTKLLKKNEWLMEGLTYITFRARRHIATEPT